MGVCCKLQGKDGKSCNKSKGGAVSPWSPQPRAARKKLRLWTAATTTPPKSVIQTHMPERCLIRIEKIFFLRKTMIQNPCSADERDVRKRLWKITQMFATGA